MKKRRLLALLLISTALLVGCSVEDTSEDDDEEEKQVEKDSKDENENNGDNDNVNEPSAEETNDDKLQVFEQYIADSEYADAIEYYNSTLSGNYELEVGAQEALVGMCNNINDKVLSGEYDKNEAQIDLGVIDKVVEGIQVTPAGYDEAVAQIDGSLASKAAFSAASDLEALENYADAIEQYELVIEGDSNYAAAQEAIEHCVDIIKTTALAEAEELVEENDYIGAINVLSEAAAVLTEDSDIQSKITVYEKSYINYVLSEADDAFVTPATDYEAALSIVNAGLQYYPEDEDLLEKKAYYASYEPVNLYDTEAIRGSADTKTTDQDTYLNTYEKCFWSGYGNYALWYETDITFNLNKSFNTFDATIYGRSSKNEAQSMEVYIYGDGALLYENSSIPDNSTPAFNISLDVTGVTELRIVMSCNGGAIGSGIGMTNMYIQKTAR